MDENHKPGTQHGVHRSVPGRGSRRGVPEEPQRDEAVAATAELHVEDPAAHKASPARIGLHPWLVVASFLAGVLISYVAWGRARPASTAAGEAAVPADKPKSSGGTLDLAALMKEVNPPDGYTLPVKYGDLGPRLIQGGVINYDAFAGVFQSGGDPLTAEQAQILRQGSDHPMVITAQDAHFLLNFLWAVGLANRNSILTAGPMVQASGGRIDGFASTGGWTLGTKPVTELYASMDLVQLTDEQQKRLEETASAIYRPCCGNPTIFPDCNHGMAMLGLLELMASQDASTEEMLTAAKYVNAFWFPQQALEAAMYLKADSRLDFAQADPRLVVGIDMFSGEGAQRVHAALSSQGLLPTATG